jgi:hypothetical protein
VLTPHPNAHEASGTANHGCVRPKTSNGASHSGASGSSAASILARDQLFGLPRLRHGIQAGDFDAAAIGQQQAADHAQGGGLAGTVGPEQCIELAPRNGEIYAVDGRSGENLDQLTNAQGRRDRLHGWTLMRLLLSKKV